MSYFETTQWTLVVAAGDGSNPESEEALASLCETYWYPLYVYVRRKGKNEDDARDLTQGFFAKLLEKNWVAAADRERGKFRTFMLTALQRYMIGEWERERAQKRGGGQSPLSLDFDTAEHGYKREVPDDRTPEDVFDTMWARTLMEQAFDRLRRETLEPGKEDRFELFSGIVTGKSDEISYKEISEKLGLSESAVKVGIHRMRKRFGDILRAAVADTVSREDDIDDELRHLLALAAA